MVASVIRSDIMAMARLGRLPPDSADAEVGALSLWERLLSAVEEGPSPNRDEVRVLIKLFPTDGTCFGLAWSLLHLIEKAESWPDHDALRSVSGEWPDRLADRMGGRRTRPSPDGAT